MPPHVIRAKGTRLAKDLEGPFVEDCVPGRVLERAVVSFMGPPPRSALTARRFTAPVDRLTGLAMSGMAQRAFPSMCAGSVIGAVMGAVAHRSLRCVRIADNDDSIA